MTDDFDGLDLIDSEGDKVGSIDRTYVDDEGNARMLSVKIGTILHSHRLVPADDVERGDGSVSVPYLKDVIEESPDFDGDDTVEGDFLTAVREYYAHDGNLTEEDQDTPDGDAMPPDAVTAIGEVDQRNRPPNDSPTVGEDTDVPVEFGQTRDLGDVVEVPVVEEVLVKKPVVREVLRVRKSHIAETGTAAADLRKEQVEVLPSSEDLVKSNNET
jgi:hypothetical protein